VFVTVSPFCIILTIVSIARASNGTLPALARNIRLGWVTGTNRPAYYTMVSNAIKSFILTAP